MELISHKYICTNCKCLYTEPNQTTDTTGHPDKLSCPNCGIWINEHSPNKNYIDITNLKYRIGLVEKHIKAIEDGLDALELKNHTKSGQSFMKYYLYAISQTIEKDVIFEIAFLRGGDMVYELKRSLSGLNNLLNPSLNK